MGTIFMPKTRDKAIEVTIANLIMAGLLTREEVTGFAAMLTASNDSFLGEQLCASNILYLQYLVECWSLN